MMKRLRPINILTLVLTFFIIIVNIPKLQAQTGDGGTNNLFLDAGVGARALSLGGAFVALSDDASAVYWNPAGLESVPKISAIFYYTGLQFGTSYSFVGVAYPTLSIGTFGFGWSRIGTDEVTERDGNANPGSVSSFNENEFYFSYAKGIRSTVSLGGSAKLHRRAFGFQNLGDTGIGLDFGLIYQPVFDMGVLRDIAFGVNIQNLIAPRKKLINTTESSRLNLKAGFSKLFTVGEAGNVLRLLFDLNKSSALGVGSTYHVGTEFSFRGNANIRFGFNDGQVAFGGGAMYRNFHFDYNFGSFFDGADFDPGHRFSITVDIGKTKTERIRIAREEQERALQIRVENELWFNAETGFNAGMESGREKYYGQDYLGAYVDFYNAFEAAESMQEISMRLRGQMTDDPEANMRVETANSSIEESQRFLALANTKSDSVRREDQKRIVLQAQQSAIEKDLRDFILEHKEKGVAFFKGGFYSRAINEWQLVVDRITSINLSELPSWVAEVKLQIQTDIQTAEKQLQGSLRETIKNADGLANRGQYVQALNMLNGVRDSGLSESERNEIESRIARYQNQLSFDQKFDEGMRLYTSKEWKRAAEAFQEALKSRSNDAKAKQYYEEAYARSIATVQEMPPNIRVKYLRGMSSYRAGNYQEALDVWEQVRKEQPYNKHILDAIDRAKDKLGQK